MTLSATETGITLPAAWTAKRDAAQRGAAVIEYQRETSGETKFIVSVMPDAADEGFELWFSTIDRTSTRVRHDYPVEEYDVLEDAVEGAESFIEMFSQRLREGSVSALDPEHDGIRDTIRAFSGDRTFPSIGRLLRRFR